MLGVAAPRDTHRPLVCQDEAERRRWARLRRDARACLASPAVAALLTPPAAPAEPQTLLQHCLVADLSGEQPPVEAASPATPHTLRPGSEAGSCGGRVSAGASGAAGAPAHDAVTPGARADAGGRDPGSGPGCNPSLRVTATPGSISAAPHAIGPRGLLADLAKMCDYGKRGSASGGDRPSAEEAEDCMRAWAAFVRLLGPAFLCPPALGSAMLKARWVLPATSPCYSHASASRKAEG